MSSKRTSRAYQDLVKLSENYFGPATKRFLTTQIKHHLHKTPAQLTYKDIPELTDWLRLALAVVTNDTLKINEYTDLVNKIGKQ